MDPNAAKTLDPKLQETYNKVMGTQTAPPAAPPAPAPEGLNQAVAGAAPTPYTQDNLSFQAAIQTPAAQAAPTPNGGQTPLAGVVQPQAGSSSSFMKILYIIGAVVFFAVYTFVWIKIFNLPLPF